MAHFKSAAGPSGVPEEDEESDSRSESSSDEEEEEKVQEENTEDEEYAAMKKELSEMSFEDLQKLKEKLGVKVFNSAMYGSKNQGGKKVFKRENKNR